jgi:hypothetical protein
MKEALHGGAQSVSSRRIAKIAAIVGFGCCGRIASGKGLRLALVRPHVHSCHRKG